MEIGLIPKPGTRARIITRNVIGHEAEDTGIIMGSPAQYGFISRKGQWSYQRINESDKPAYRITIQIESDRGGHREAKSVPFRIDKILRMERLNGSK